MSQSLRDINDYFFGIISIKVGVKAEIDKIHFNLLGHGSVFAFGFAATGWHPREIGSAFHRAGGFTRIV
jgi:hypothetical protein